MSRSHGIAFRAAVFFLAVFLPLSASGFDSDETGAVRNWSIRIGEIDRHLMESEWKKALRNSEKLINEMVNRIIRGSAAREYLGNAVMRQAIAFSGTGEIDNATWTMQVALQILPSLSGFPLDRYGAEGKRLQSVKVRELRDRLLAEHETTNAKPTDSAKITPPKMIKGRNPVFPWAKRTGSEFHVIVEVLLGKDGVPRHPVIEKSDGEFTAVYAVLNEMREWRFRPGRLDGELVEVIYILQATFRP